MLGWEKLEPLHCGPRSTLIRARRASDGALYVLKSSNLPSPDDTLQREHRVLSALLGCEGVVRSHGVLRDERRQSVLVLENVAGESLAARMARGELPPVQALSLAHSLLALLAKVHGRGVVHADLCPQNILLVADGSLRVVDFASAVSVGAEPARPLVRGNVQRAIAYAAPEQIGRIHRRVDPRSDYYSFGVLLYRMLTGRLPFEDTDPLELAHAHVARRPPPPREIVNALTPALARVMLKLLEKDPDARYQSEARLSEDLARCLAAEKRGERGFDGLSTQAEAPSFVLTAHLFGRDAVLSRLEDAVDRALRGHLCAIVIEGSAGMGKTALAEELRRSVSLHHGFFIRAKYDAEQGADPAGPLRQALLSLAEQVAAFAGPRLSALREKLALRVPGAAAALVAFCPALQLVLPTSASEDAARDGAVDLVPRAAGELLRALSELGAPVCMFVDDLQWTTDSAWRALREVFAAAQKAPLGVVVAYRTDGTDATLRCRTLLAELSEQGFVPTVESLDALSRTELGSLVRASLADEPAKLEPLIALLWKQSLGHPLRTRTLLTAICETCVEVDAGGRPHVDLERACDLLSGGDADAWLAQRFRTLSPQTRRALGLAACIGSSFELAILETILHLDVHASLGPAVAAGIVAAFDDFSSSRAGAAAHSAAVGRFAHDHARQVVLEGLEAPELVDCHLALGRYFMGGLVQPLDRRTLFAAVDHLERVQESLSASEKASLYALQLCAVREATRAGFGDLALDVARKAISALPRDPWQAAPERTRALILAQAEAAFEWADHDTLTAACEVLRAHADAPSQLVDVLTLEGRFYQSQFRSQQAIAAYAQALDVLGVPISDKPSESELAAELACTVDLLRGHSDDAILSLHECRDERVRREVFLLGKLVLFSYSASHALLSSAACRIVRLSLLHGHAPESAGGYAFYGLMVARGEHISEAVRFARIALELAERFGSASVLSNAHLYVNYQLMHWTLTFKELMPGFVKAYHYGLAAGSATNACCAATTLCISKFWAGEPLAPLAAELNEHRALLVRFKQKLVLNWHDVLMQLVQQLREPSAHPADLSGPLYEERARVAQHRTSKDTASLFNYAIAKGLLCVVYHAPEAALAAVDESAELSTLYGASMWAVPLATLDALARLMALPSLAEQQRAEQLARVDADVAKLEGFLRHNPREVEHRLHLVRGLRAAARGQFENAARWLSEAVELAAREAPAWEALAAEHFARFWLARGERHEARAALRRAHRAYHLWGAHGKVHDLEREHPGLLSPAAWGRGADATVELDALDLMGVLAASRAIAGELRLDALLERLMALVVETAGAERGFLLLPQGTSWVVEAGRTAEGRALPTLKALSPTDLPSEFGGGLNVPLIAQVAATGEPASSDQPAFTAAGMEGSLLCFPFKRQGQLETIAYLENRLVRGVFGGASIKVLEVLSGQVVIAIQNARLVRGLETEVSARTQALQQKNAELEGAMEQLLELQNKLVLKEKLAALGALTAGIAHEVKNPLNFVVNFAEVAKELSADLDARISALGAHPLLADLSELRNLTERIVTHARRAGGIVDSMALHSPQLPLDAVPRNLNSVVERALSSVPGAVWPGVALLPIVTLALDPALMPVRMGEEAMVRVVVNLLTNAFHSLRAKAGTLSDFKPQLVLCTRNLEQGVELSVRDNGLGIAHEMRDKIFMPFVTTKLSGQGTGLGLSLSYDVVVRGHGGTLRCESEDGAWAELIVTLPHTPASVGPARSAWSPSDVRLTP
jgi:predicted ATPase/signal transduction histidine kinase